jgi:hypothetical protein
MSAGTGFHDIGFSELKIFLPKSVPRICGKKNSQLQR